MLRACVASVVRHARAEFQGRPALLCHFCPSASASIRASAHISSSRSSLIASGMRAVQITEQGGTDVLKVREVEAPSALPGTVVVRNAVAGINFIDTYHRSGLYTVALPYTLGVDGAGEVVEVGEGVTGFKPGDRVAYMGSGSYAELTRVSASTTAHVPEGLSLEAAATAMVQGMTALSLVRYTYQVKAGDWVLVHAAAGGTGQLITQLASQLGAHVIGTVSTQEKADLAKSLGAEHIILYTEADVAAEVKRITGGKGVAVAYDGVGASTFEASRASLAPRGLLVSFGNASGKVPAVDVFKLTPGNIYLARPSLFEYFKADENAFGELSSFVLDAVAKGKLKVRVAGEFPLEKVADAHEALESRATMGKLLLRL